jgi:hypothetical protein
VEPKNKFVPLKFILYHAKFWKFWCIRSNLFIFYKLESVWILENDWNLRKGLNRPTSFTVRPIPTSNRPKAVGTKTHLGQSPSPRAPGRVRRHHRAHGTTCSHCPTWAPPPLSSAQARREGQRHFPAPTAITPHLLLACAWAPITPLLLAASRCWAAELSSPHASLSIGQDRAMLCHDSSLCPGAIGEPRASAPVSTSTPRPLLFPIGPSHHARWAAAFGLRSTQPTPPWARPRLHDALWMRSWPPRPRYRADRFLHHRLRLPPYWALPPTTDALLRHHSDLHPSSELLTDLANPTNDPFPGPSPSSAAGRAPPLWSALCGEHPTQFPPQIAPLRRRLALVAVPFQLRYRERPESTATAANATWAASSPTSLFSPWETSPARSWAGWIWAHGE